MLDECRRESAARVAEQHVNYAWIGRENLRHDNLRDDWKKVAWIDIDEK